MITRRAALQVPLFALPAFSAAGRDTAITFNEDNSHYFFTRAGQEFTAEKVASYVDQFAGTQVREVLLSGNSQRTSFASKVWDPIWKGYDPKGPDDQPMFASTPKEGRAMARGWVHTAWKLNQQGLDAYALWIKRAREKKLSPWISMRMNDLHNVDDPQSYMHPISGKRTPNFAACGGAPNRVQASTGATVPSITCTKKSATTISASSKSTANATISTVWNSTGCVSASISSQARKCRATKSRWSS